jgi:probable rRNA maturation factor
MPTKKQKRSRKSKSPARILRETTRGRKKMANKINITFDCFTLRQPQIAMIISKCVESTLIAEGIEPTCEINVLVTNDRGIQAINLASRNIDKPTDVLSFPMYQLEAGNPPADWQEYLDIETGMCPLGDMCISLERAIAQAKEFGHSVKREVGYLTIHSMLHLLGYDHMDEGEQKAQMRAREEAIAATIPGMTRK